MYSKTQNAIGESPLMYSEEQWFFSSISGNVSTVYIELIIHEHLIYLYLWLKLLETWVWSSQSIFLLQLLKLKITPTIHLAAAGLSLMLVKRGSGHETLFSHKRNIALWRCTSYHSLTLQESRKEIIHVESVPSYSVILHLPQELLFSFTQQQAIFRILLCIQQSGYSSNKAACLRLNPTKHFFCTQTVSLKSMRFLEWALHTSKRIRSLNSRKYRQPC